jgi:hypothetical protein
MMIIIKSGWKKWQISSVCIAIGYELDGWGSIPDRGKRYFLLHSVQTGSGAHPASYTTHLHLMPRSKEVDIYLYSPIRLNDVVLN